MSDIQTDAVASDVAQSEGVADATNPVESGPVGSNEAESASGEASSASAERIDLSAYGDHLVTIKVDGEERDVPLSELRNGYMRQDAFTKKTQEISALRTQLGQAEALMTAFQTNPQGTLRQLADHLGMTVAEAQQHVDDAADFIEEVDPVVERLERIERTFQSQQQAEISAQIENEFATLEAQFGEIDRAELASHAMKHGGTVTDAYKVLNFDKFAARASKQSQEDGVVDAKRQAQIVQTGGKPRTAAVGKAPQGEMSLRESIAAAVREARSAG